MKPVAFELVQAADLPAAFAALGAGARPIAGAQSLGPMLNLRLARPTRTVDISRIPDLRGARDECGAVLYGAAVTHAEIEDGAVPDATPGWLAAVARGIAYRAVRNRGTLGGSLAHADPAADWVTVLTALGAEVVVASGDTPAGRTVGLDALFTGAFATVLGADEIITHVRVARPGASARWGYWKFCRKLGEFAKASAAVLIDPDRAATRIVIGAIERPPAVLADPETVLADPAAIDAAIAAAAPGMSDEQSALQAVAVRRAVAIARATSPDGAP